MPRSGCTGSHKISYPPPPLQPNWSIEYGDVRYHSKAHSIWGWSGKFQVPAINLVLLVNEKVKMVRVRFFGSCWHGKTPQKSTLADPTGNFLRKLILHSLKRLPNANSPAQFHFHRITNTEVGSVAKSTFYKGWCTLPSSTALLQDCGSCRPNAPMLRCLWFDENETLHLNLHTIDLSNCVILAPAKNSLCSLQG